MLDGGLAPVGLLATTVSPDVPQAPSVVAPAKGGWAVTKLSKSNLIWHRPKVNHQLFQCQLWTLPSQILLKVY